MSEEDDVPPVVPYLTVNRALDAIEHYRRAFGAEVFLKYMDDDGKRVNHAALGVFGTMIFLSDEFPEYADEVKSPPSVGGHGRPAYQLRVAAGCRLGNCQGRSGGVPGDYAGGRRTLGHARRARSRSFRSRLDVRRPIT